jgi:2-dehydropantoate 2-reductase
MTTEKPAQYVIFGAGAIGTAVGGLLVKAGLRVRFVGRPDRAEAIREGVTLQLDEGPVEFKGEAATTVREVGPAPEDIIFITTKSQATEAAVEELALYYDRGARVVCFQNGVRNEEIAARRFDNVYAGLVYLSAVQLEPRLVAVPHERSLAIGRYPGGVDPTADRIREDLDRAGLSTTLSAYVMAIKWGKLVANLNNATHAITGYWLEKGMSDPEMRRLMLEVREEGLRVLDAAGIAVEPPAGEPSPIRIRQMTDALRRPPKPPADTPPERRTYASMWQDLQLGRKTSEAEFLNGEIVAIGREVGLQTPYNSALLEIINRMVEEGTRPGIYTPSELHELILSRQAADKGNNH